MSKARTLFGGLVGLLITTSADARDCARIGTTSPAELHREWIMTGWEKRTGDAPFDFRTKLGKYYDWSSTDVLLYDDLAPERRMARSAEAYGAMWTPIFVSQREVRHAVVDGPDAIIGGELDARIRRPPRGRRRQDFGNPRPFDARLALRRRGLADRARAQLLLSRRSRRDRSPRAGPRHALRAPPAPRSPGPARRRPALPRAAAAAKAAGWTNDRAARRAPTPGFQFPPGRRGSDG